MAPERDRDPGAAPIPPPRPETDLVTGVVLSIGVGALAGAVAGLVWGGFGGRIAMRILFLTSDDTVRGQISDDGFEIGRISADSIFLFLFMTVIGGILGAVYGAFRMLLRGPPWLVTLGVATALGTGAGATIVSPDGVDFRILEPLWLAVALFMFLPAAWGFTVVASTDRILHHRRIIVPAVPSVDSRPLGMWGSTAAWAILSLMTASGLADLIDDLQRLN